MLVLWKYSIYVGNFIEHDTYAYRPCVGERVGHVLRGGIGNVIGKFICMHANPLVIEEDSPVQSTVLPLLSLKGTPVSHAIQMKIQVKGMFCISVVW